jgi:hypothetical protein
MFTDDILLCFTYQGDSYEAVDRLMSLSGWGAWSQYRKLQQIQERAMLEIEWFRGGGVRNVLTDIREYILDLRRSFR